MKIKKLLVLVSMLAVMFSLAGCSETYDKPFEYDETEIAVHTIYSFMTYENISDEYVDYYINSGSEYEKSAVKGITQAKEIDKIGEYEDFSGKLSSLENNFMTLDEADIEIENNKDYVTVVLLNKAENRDVEISVKYVENSEYYIILNQTLVEQGLESYEVFETGIQYAAAINGKTMDEIFTLNGVSNMEELYQLGVEQAEMSLHAQGIYPYIEEEMVVAAVYSTKELMGQAAMNTIIGMGTVFIVLIFISFVISLFKYLPALFAKKPKVEFDKKTEKAKASATAPMADNDPQLIAAITAATMASAEDDSQLIAVITAAIREYEAQSGDGSISKDKLVVRSVKRARR